MLKTRCLEKFHPNFEPKIIVTDFETSLLSCIQTYMSTVKHLCCYFQYTQCVYRKIQTLGLVCQYRTNPQLQRIVRTIFALPFLPSNTVTSLFQSFRPISDVRRILLINSQFEQFFKFVERQWILGTSVDIWNVYDRDGPTRTTNICEGWNSNWKHQLGKNQQKHLGCNTSFENSRFKKKSKREVSKSGTT